VLLRVRFARVAAIERARANAPSSKTSIPGFPTDQEWEEAFSHLAHVRPKHVTSLLTRGADAVRVFSEKTLSASADRKEPEQMGQDKPQPAVQEEVNGTNSLMSMANTEVETLRRALPDLMSFDRYARRAAGHPQFHRKLDPA
jgi:hypothetical protein